MKDVNLVVIRVLIQLGLVQVGIQQQPLYVCLFVKMELRLEMKHVMTACRIS